MSQSLNRFTLFIKQRPIQTLVILFLYTILSPYLSPKSHQGLYTISILIKDLLVWIMPLTVGFFIAQTLSSFQKKAPLFVLAIILFEFLSNFCSVWYAYGCANLVDDTIPAFGAMELESSFAPLWRLPFSKPAWWAADKGSLVGLLLGCLAGLTQEPRLRKFVKQGKNTMEWILTRVFARLIPLFVLGFIAHIHQTHLLSHMIAHYATLILWLAGFLMAYLIFIFFAGADFSIEKTLYRIKNLLPAAGISLTSGCSLSTMPWTISGTAKNLQLPDLAKAVIPATTNIQQVGDCIANCFLCFLIFRNFYGYNPSLSTWALFSLVFVLARFATAAVLGGAIFIMLPIYESYLHFTPEMIAIILALNVILDPIITSSNVVGNGALCNIFERFFDKVLGLVRYKKPI